MNSDERAQSTISADATVGEIVADNFRTAKVFESHGIDFCCGGNVPLTEVCREKGIDPAMLERELAEARNAPIERSCNYATWTLSFLADYIINTHHAYLNENTGQIAAYTDKIAAVHGARHPEVIEIAAIFAKIVTDMAAHLREEEDLLFPAVKRVEAASKEGKAPAAGDLATVRASLEKLGREHEEIGDAVHAIRRLAKEYAVPDDVCNTFAVTYRMLKEFEDDLHKHVHLENNILFPKAAGSQ